MCVLKIVRVRTIYLLFAMNSTDICVYSYMAFYTLFSISLLIFEHAADAFAPVRFRFSQCLVVLVMVVVATTTTVMVVVSLNVEHIMNLPNIKVLSIVRVLAHGNS